MQNNKPHIITIGGGNGHSNILAGIHETFENRVNLSSIVSMSDDGRTTGLLMRYFSEDLSIHFPPPWDLRRCLYVLSESKYNTEFQKYFEMVLVDDVSIDTLTLGDISRMAWAYEFLEKINFPYFEVKLPLGRSLNGHKFGNIFMGFLFYHFDQNYEKMMDAMHTLLEVKSNIIPVTTDAAYIQATLGNGVIIEKQDNISNVCGYDSRIIKLSLMEGSHGARYAWGLVRALTGVDYIILAPGDLYTSTLSNLIIWGMKELIRHLDAKIIYVANNTNKWGETNGYAILDFILEIERYLGKPIDIVIANDKKLDLNFEDIQKLKTNISVKWGEYIYITDDERAYLESRKVQIIEDDLIDRTSLYKHDSIKLAKILENIIFSEK